MQGTFHEKFGTDLSKAIRAESWKWFWSRVQYLLRTDNALSRHFTPKAEPPAEEVPPFNPMFDDGS